MDHVRCFTCTIVKRNELEENIMTRKRFINLIRAISTEIVKGSDNRNIHKGWEQGYRHVPARLKEVWHGHFSYEELFEPLKPVAHKYGIGGY